MLSTLQKFIDIDCKLNGDFEFATVGGWWVEEEIVLLGRMRWRA